MKPPFLFVLLCLSALWIAAQPRPARGEDVNHPAVLGSGAEPSGTAHPAASLRRGTEGRRQDSTRPPTPEMLPTPAPDFRAPFEDGMEFDDPWLGEDEWLPPLAEELWNHGGSYLYAPEGDRLHWPADDEHAHYQYLRLPESWPEPRPLTGITPFLGADPVIPRGAWFGSQGYSWEPRFVAAGNYRLFGLALEENNRRQDLIGHRLAVDLDLRLTGTDRFHVQYRPLDREDTGGSYYRFSEPEGYVDNSTGVPDRYWFEAELHSLLGADFDPFASLDYSITVGRVPVVLHNFLLMNDELLAVILNKNTLIFGEVSNLNVLGIYGFDELSTVGTDDARLYAVHASIDRHRVFYESTYAFVEHDQDASQNAHYAAVSRTALYGPRTLALRALVKLGDRGGRGSGQLFVAETLQTRVFDDRPCGVEKGVFYCNAFLATQGWNSIAGGNFDRLRASFEVNPLVRVSALPVDNRIWGVALGVQLFRRHDDESFVPEVAYEHQRGRAAVGFGLRWLRKTGPRTYLEALGSLTLSDDPALDREGVALTYTVLF